MQGPLLQLQNCSLSGNTALDEDGGGVHCARVPLLLAGSHLRNNTANQVSPLASASTPSAGFKKNPAGNFVCVCLSDRQEIQALAICIQHSPQTLVSSCALQRGGGVYGTSARSFVAAGCVLDWNRAGVAGGAAYLESGDVVQVWSCSWSGAWAGFAGHGCPCCPTACTRKAAPDLPTPTYVPRSAAVL